MNDINSQGDLPPLTADQIRGLAAALRDVFGRNLSRAQFADKMLVFLEDVPGYESGAVNASILVAQCESVSISA